MTTIATENGQVLSIKDILNTNEILLEALEGLVRQINAHYKWTNVRKDFSLMVADACARKAIKLAKGATT